MKSVKVNQPGELAIIEEQIPELLDSKSVLVKVKAAGICGSDLSIYKGTSPVATYPRVIGHEFAGEIIEIGKDVQNLCIGDHVSINPVISCGYCNACKKGRGNVCKNLTVIGVHTDGGFREYLTVPASNAMKVASEIPWEQAAIIEPYTVAAQVNDRGGIKQGDMILILGAGPIAIAILQVAKMKGARVIITDLIDERLKLAKEAGADFVINTGYADIKEEVMKITENEGVDVSIDAACVGITLLQAISCTGPGGVVVTMGFSNKPSNIQELSITMNELDLRGTRLNNEKFPEVISWVEAGKLDLTKIITDQYDFEDILKAFDKIKSFPESTSKVILTFA
ncbi:MAG: zinc-binding alcohol dehydrogenase family protein [Clostridiaceae bacterium]